MTSDKRKKIQKGSQEYLKYAGLAATLFVSLFVSYYLGHLLDKYWELEKPYIGLLSMILVMAAYFYKLIKDFS